MSGQFRRTASAIARFYGFEEISTSVLEDASLFVPLVRAGLFEERPPVWCKARSGDEFMLRPSAILGAVRAYCTHRLQTLPHPLKFVCEAEGFFLSRRGAAGAETPNAVVMRREWGLVMIGEDAPVAEAEIIQVLWRSFLEWGVKEDALNLRLNAVGCGQCRPAFRSSLTGYLRARSARLCSASKRDLKRAPIRVLSCPEERCRGVRDAAPQILDFLCERCKKHLRGLLEFLDEARIPYMLDPRLFREGSWMSDVIFEVIRRDADRPPSGQAESEEKNSAESGMKAAEGSAPAVQDSTRLMMSEGGRISKAAELLNGGKTLHAVSGALFLDNIISLLQGEIGEERPDVFFVQLGELAKRKSLEILEVLRKAGIAARESLGRDSIKVQLKIAENLGVRWALILGQKEALDSTIIFREVESGIQEIIPQEKLIDLLRKKLKR